MQTKRLVLGVASALLIVAGASVRADDKPVTIARTVKAGATSRSKVTINANVGGMDIVVVTTAKTEAKEIDKKGNIVWVETTEKVVLNDAPQAEAEGKSQTVTRDKMNKLVEFKVEESGTPFTPETQRLMAASAEVILPDKAVKAGDSWTTEFDNPLVKGKKATTKTTFVGVEKVDGKELWKLKQTTSADTGEGDTKTSSETTAWLDPADGSMVKAEASVKEVPTTFGANISFTMKLEKLKAEKADKVDKAA